MFPPSQNAATQTLEDLLSNQDNKNKMQNLKFKKGALGCVITVVARINKSIFICLIDLQHNLRGCAE